MATEIILNRWCDGVKLSGTNDWALRHEIQTAPGTVRIHGLDGKPAKSVDLCDPCDNDMTLAELRICLREFGVTPEAGKKGKPVDQPRLTAGSGGGVATLAINNARSGQRHGRPPSSPRTESCLWCPLDYTHSGFAGHAKKHHGFANIVDALGTRCPVCGVDGFQMLSSHVGRAHDYKSVTAAFMWARDNGDPHGVYAERRAAGQNIVEALA